MKIHQALKFIPLVLFTTIGCWHHPHHFHLWGQPGPQGPAGTPGQDGSDGKSFQFPIGIRLDTVNQVNSYLSQEGLVLISSDTTALPNDPGRFDDAPTCSPNTRIGNKAYVGIFATEDSDISGTPLSDLKSITFKARKDDGTISSTYLNLLVDCDGSGTWDPTTDAIVTVSPSPSLTFDLNKQWTTITILPTDSLFRSVGGHCGLADHVTGAANPLNVLTAGHPNAKLIAAVPKDCGMPRNVTMSPILFLQGDSNTNQVLRTTLQKIELKIGTKTQTYQFGN